ncbi:aminotransferase [Polychytrium aggregatum]|uniref:aminotransferase n=1 Tax=Polychytrium aggregatum TaxID=110093 RepID=UPI0022FE68F6|nr:aminotransferase [Polychytrium aggregatum]KAI9193384.1 aminotransferase [Polychytrium aggregatum]
MFTARPFAALARASVAAPASARLRFFATASALKDLSAKDIKITQTTKSKEMLPLKDLVFGHTFSDHMLIAEWEATKGWANPEIKPYGKLSLDPSATVFHYAIECFEGMKAYKDKEGKIRLFRPDMNMNRLLRSCKRLTLPAFDKDELLKCIKALLKVDSKWIPGERGYSLYIRPTAIATQESLGVGASNKAMIFVIASPVGPYYKTGFAAVSLYATTKYVRAWPGGTGDAKIGSNYAPGIRPQIEVAQQGYQQNLWLFGDNVTEVGTMNFFALWKNEAGETELITPPLDGTILPGVTRDSILTLAREWNQFKVTERPITMSELAKGVKEGRVLEMFGAGTAAIVSPIKNINYKGEDLAIPLDPKDPTSQAGPWTKKFADVIMGIQYGEIPHKWSVVVD